MFAGCTEVAERPAAPDPDAVVIGLLLPYSGVATDFGIAHDRSARLAVREINEAGGINGQPLDLIGYDNRGAFPEGPLVSTTAVDELADRGAVAVVGPDFSYLVVELRDALVARQLPLIAVGATSPRLTTLVDDDLVYRTIASDALQGAVLADLLARDGHTVVALARRDDVYGNGLADTLRSHFEGAGGSVLADVSYAPGTMDFGPVVSELYAAGAPPAIAILSTGTEATDIMQALYRIDPQARPALYGGDGSEPSFVANNAPPELAVGFKSTFPSTPDDSPRLLQFQAAYQAVVGDASDPVDPVAYDAVYLVALAMLQGGESSAAAVHAHLREVSRPDSAAAVVIGIGPDEVRLAQQSVGADLDFEGGSGSIDFDPAGDVTSATYTIREVVDLGDGPVAIDREQVTYSP